MPIDGLYAEIVRVRPKSEQAKARMLEIREELVTAYDQKYAAFRRALLLEPEEGGTLVDIWLWSSKPEAEAALAEIDQMPLFQEWLSLVDDEGFEWASVVSDRTRA